MQLKQRHFFDKRAYQLTDRTLKVHFKNPTSDVELELKLEQLGEDLIRSTSKKYSVVTAALFFFAIIFGRWLFDDYVPKSNNELIVLLVAGLIPFSIIAFTVIESRKKEVAIVGGEKDLTFFAHKPSTEVVDEFITEVLSRRKKIVITKMLNIGSSYYSNHQRTEYLNELRIDEYITEEELKEYMNLIEPKPNKMGF